MDAAEVVVGHEQGDSSLKVEALLGKRVGQAGEAAKLHPHGEVVAFHIRRADVVRVRVTDDDLLARGNNAGRAVAAFVGARCLPRIDLVQHGEVHVSEAAINRAPVGLQVVRRQLDLVPQARFQIAHEHVGAVDVAVSDVEGRDQFAVGINRRPQPYVARVRVPFQNRRVLFDRLALGGMSR